MRKIKNLSIYIAFFLCITFLFAGKPGFYTARSSIYLWDLGHVLLFSLVSILIIQKIKWFNRFSLYKQLWYIITFSLFTGILIELAQVKFDRTPDVYDLLRNILGSVLGVAFYSPRRHKISIRIRKAIQILLIILTSFALYPFTAALVDEAIAWSQFPILSDFETPMEVNRWQNHFQLKLEKGLARKGDHSMRVSLTTSKYSGVSLKYFPNDWRDYTHLNFSIYNPDNDTLRVICRIHDVHHNHSFNDRYNEAFYLKYGWNDFQIPINDILLAPKERRMDLSQIELIGIFTVRSPRRRLIYLDSFRLSR
jgi:VanZ family protein